MSDEKTCSLKVVAPDGRLLHGTAAVNHMISRNGGFDQWVGDLTERVAKEASAKTVEEMLKQERKPKLKAV